MNDDRIRCPQLARKVMSAEDAAEVIAPGATVGMSGFTGAGYPKTVPGALAKRITDANSCGRPMRVSVWTGASTAPELDGVLAEVDGIEQRLPYQSDPATRAKINAGGMDYLDLHLSQVAQMVWQGFLGPLDVAVVEVSGITEEGHLIPSTSVGNNKTWIDQADKVILEVNSWQSEGLAGMHDVYYGTALPPARKPIPITRPGDRIGVPHLICPPEKVVAVVQTHSPDRNTTFKAPDETSCRIAGHVLDFLAHEVKVGRLPAGLLPIQSGVGNVANAVLAGLADGPFENLTAYTEVIQDGMLELLDRGTVAVASATALSLSTDAAARFNSRAAEYRDRIVLRPQEISNHPEVVRRLGCLAMNGMIEADIYGNVNSTHVMGSRIQNGIGGSGDFARNGHLSFFVTPSQAKGGAISAIVPMVSHTDHTEHDVDVIVTEQGLADLRGLSPKQRARQIIERCAHPDFRPELEDYFHRALESSHGLHSPHLLTEALSWHSRYLDAGTMRRS
ncbi:MAG TPA: acetyl-CoA hydrolase/transferase family protein [Pseudonocardiaceae bacterium]|jgi:succinyl-CoA:acetate CoA-transferase|nr:acetyl-CoA hydrolase/transferase family protein [Pseudonocardiaceae bacterium]